jgi:hypothetical protein
MDAGDNRDAIDEIFRRVVSENRHGWRFDAGNLAPDSGLRTILERHRNDAERWLEDVRARHAPRMGPVHFDYVENRAINAVAFEAERHEFVGIWVGAMASIYSFFGCLLADPHFLPTIGDISAEAQFEEASDEVAWLIRTPNDPARKSYAHLLSTLAVEFLFRHELGHLMNGHVKLLGQRHLSNFIVEFEEPGAHGLSSLERQTLEMDADSFAVGIGMATVLGRLSEPDRIFPQHWRQWYSSPRQALYTWLLSINVLFHLLYNGPVNLDDLESKPHPPPAIRMLMVESTVYEFLRMQSRDDLLAEFEAIVEEAIHTALAAYALVTGSSPDLTGWLQATDPRSSALISRLTANWKTIRPQLEPLNRGGRLAD